MLFHVEAAEKLDMPIYYSQKRRQVYVVQSKSDIAGVTQNY